MGRGRKPKLSEVDIPRIREWQDGGKLNGQIADLLGVHRVNLQKFLSKHNLTHKENPLPDIDKDRQVDLVWYARKAANRLSRYYSANYPGFDRYELESRLMWESWFGYSKWDGRSHLATFLNRRFDWTAKKYADQLTRERSHFNEYKQLAKMRQVYVY